MENNKSFIKILLVLQEGQESILEIMKNKIKTTNEYKIEINFEVYKIEYENNNKTIIEQQFCDFYMKGCSILIDITWNNQNINISSYAQKLNMPYLKVDIFLGAIFKVIDSFLSARNATDVTMIFENMENVEKAFCYWMDNISIRLAILNGMDLETYERINKTNFVPSFYVMVATTENIKNMLQNLMSTKLLKFPERLVLVFLDMQEISEIKSKLSGKPVSIITYDKKICCGNSACNKCPLHFDVRKKFLENFIAQVIKIVNDFNKNGLDVFSTTDKNCSSPSKFPVQLFYEFMNNSKENVVFMDENYKFVPKGNAIIEVGDKNGNFNILGKYNGEQGFVLESGNQIKPNKKFYRVASAIATPWNYLEKDAETGETRLAGYCMDFIAKLAEVMNFEYELNVTDTYYGVKQRNGKWNGLVGELIDGQIDLVVGPMTMTAEREEAIDFVTPVFASSGITIVTRKPVPKSSMFKFVSVLDIQVWLIIIAALITTALILFAIDYCSPFSARNKKYPQKCREFNIVECFWFVLFSCTPQGGGEPPMSLSGRILVGAYWIFVVLLLATFTANLSAFLTLERMQLQPPQYSLDQLIRQNRINYTVMNNSWPHAYFKNMRNTENNIFKLWRSLSLNKSSDETRVWDYPIKEIYSNVLKAINDAVPVKTVEEGYRKVLEHPDGDFAFIHDYSEIRYALARTCYLVEVGEPFAERPYAVAVQQGSVLLEEVSKAIQQLRRNGYFEFLKDKYWRNNSRGECPDEETSDGITVTSLGGAFIASIAVLMLAIISLIIEIINVRGWCGMPKVNKTKAEIFATKKDMFEKDFRRSEAAFRVQNKSLNKFIKPQEPLDSYLHPARNNFREAGVMVAKGNYFTVNPRRPLHPEGKKEKLFLN